MIRFFRTYGKLIFSIGLALWAGISPLWFGDHHIDGYEWAVLVTLVANVALVYIVPLRPDFRWSKTIINALLASAAAAQTLAFDGYQPEDWRIIAGAAVGVLVVAWAPAITQGTDRMPHVVVPAGLTTG